MDLNLLRRMAGIPTLVPSSIAKSNTVANEFRKLAGLSQLPIKEDDKDDKEEMPAEEMPAEEMPAEEMPADGLPDIVKAIASQAEGKTGEELMSLIHNVYMAGFKDGSEHEDEEGGEEAK